MEIGIVGLGYVGLATLAALLASNEKYKLYGFDSNKIKVANFKNKLLNCVESDIKDTILKANFDKFYLSNEINKYINNLDVIFICVGTPTKNDGCSDVSAIYDVIEIISCSQNKNLDIIIKSTIPIGTCSSIKSKFSNLNLIFMPEFLRESTSLYDTLKPSRIIFGIEKNKKVPDRILCLYEKIKSPKLFVSYEEAETIKYACNNFLAMKISFINMIRQLCDVYEINMETISYAMGLDERIGMNYLQSGIGFGGGCFPKDNMSLITQFEKLNINADLLREIKKINENIPKHFCNKISKIIKDLQLKNEVSILRCVFKENTNDLRESQTIKLIEELLLKKIKINIFEKAAYFETNEHFKKVKDVNIYSDFSKILKSGDIIVITVMDKYFLKELKNFDLKEKILITPYEEIIYKEKKNFKKCIKI